MQIFFKSGSPLSIIFPIRALPTGMYGRYYYIHIFLGIFLECIWNNYGFTWHQLFTFIGAQTKCIAKW